MTQLFRGAEPADPASVREARLGIAAMKLSEPGDLTVYEALYAGLPVHRSRLRRSVLDAIGEPPEGDPLVLDDAIALRVAVSDSRPGNGASRSAAETAALLEVAAPAEDAPPPAYAPVNVLGFEDFLALPDPAVPTLIGTKDDALVVAGGMLLMAGEGGASKTTLTIDAIVHLASGTDWLGWTVENPVRCLVLENEGPRHKFRAKLEKKKASWTGDAFEENVLVYADPWGHANFGDPGFRRELRAIVTDENVDLVAADPLQSLGVEGAGTPEETTRFVYWMREIGLFSDVAFWVLHHFRKGDVRSILEKLAGAWGGHPDSILGVHLEGKNRTKITYAKLRWADGTGEVKYLAWKDGGFELLEPAEIVPDEEIRARIDEYLRTKSSGANSTEIKANVKGNAKRILELIRAAVDAGEILNLGTETRPKWALADVLGVMPLSDLENSTIPHSEAEEAQTVPPFLGEEPPEERFGNGSSTPRNDEERFTDA